MFKKFSLKYFQNKLRKLRLTISRMENYKSIDTLFAMQNSSSDAQNINFIQPQGRGK